MKLAIISPVLPPDYSGQSIALYHLFQNTNPEEYILISPKKYSIKTDEKKKCSNKLPGKYYHIPHWHSRLLRLMLKASYYKQNSLRDIYLKKRIGIFINLFQKEKISHVIACTADLFDPYCAYLACHQLHIPFYFYAFDDYTDQWTDKYYFEFAKTNGPLIIKNATKIIVPNEFLQSYYYSQYSIDVEVIHNPVNLSNYYSEDSFSHDNFTGPEICIAYTGSIYEAQHDAIIRLTRAISKIKGYSVRLHIFSSSPWDPAEIQLPFVVKHQSALLSKIPTIQKKAQMLFLPLAFHSDYSANLIKTSSPGKMGEYLASGRPIIVHAPEDSFVSWYFTYYKCGVVVETEDERELIDAIERIITDRNFRETICYNAQKRAIIDFNQDTVRMNFFALFH